MPVGVVGCMLTLVVLAAEVRDAKPPDGIAADVNGDPITEEKTLPEQGLPGESYTVNLVVD